MQSKIQWVEENGNNVFDMLYMKICDDLTSRVGNSLYEILVTRFGQADFAKPIVDSYFSLQTIKKGLKTLEF